MRTVRFTGPTWPRLYLGALNQHVRIPLDVESERPPEVDVREVRRPIPPNGLSVSRSPWCLRGRFIRYDN